VPPTATPLSPTWRESLAEYPEEERWIDVDLSEQQLVAYEGSTPVRVVTVSTGLPGTPTPVGRFRIWIKLEYDDMEGPGYYLPDVPYVMYFYLGYGLHGVYWHDDFGQPMSHGCVNLPTPEAGWLFHWAEVGTLVNVHE
jgi:lipoprotein-anchoring transpeptidase ErfK/SrfK